MKKTWGSRTYPVEYTYDYAGRMKTMKTWQDFASGTGDALTEWRYNQRGFLTNKLYADLTGPKYTYTPTGHLLLRTWARGALTAYNTNSAGDLAAVSKRGRSRTSKYLTHGAAGLRLGAWPENFVWSIPAPSTMS